jgi:hypothetical protein
MHDLHIAVKHRGRENVGGVVIKGDPPAWDENFADLLYRSIIYTAGLAYRPIALDAILPRDGILKILSEWMERDHHDKDPVYRTKFEAKSANIRISGRLMANSPFMTGTRLDIAFCVNSMGPYLPPEMKTS